MDPAWLAKARSYLGQTEIKGRKHNPVILRWWVLIRAHFTDDETPYCAAFVGAVLEECGIRSSRSAAARSYLRWGVNIHGPAVGAIVVFKRGAGGHVGFVVGRDTRGNLMVLGGNQGDKVSIAPFDVNRVLGYRWPPVLSPPAYVGAATLPTLNSYAPAGSET